MQVNLKSLVSITEANQNFPKVARLVDENGSAVILKNNVPRYLIIELQQFQKEELAEMADVRHLAQRIVDRNRKAFEELSQ